MVLSNIQARSPSRIEFRATRWARASPTRNYQSLHRPPADGVPVPPRTLLTFAMISLLLTTKVELNNPRKGLTTSTIVMAMIMMILDSAMSIIITIIIVMIGMSTILGHPGTILGRSGTNCNNKVFNNHL